MSGADPRTTFLGLVPDGALETAFRERVENWTTHGCVVKLNLALRELPDFTARPGRGPQHHGTIEISPSLEYLHEAYTDAQTAGHSNASVDGGVRPVGARPVARRRRRATSCAASRSTSRPKTFDPPVTRDHASEAAMRTLASYAPNVLDAVVAAEALGPVELEERFGLPGGDIFHGSLLPDQSLRPALRLPDAAARALPLWLGSASGRCGDGGRGTKRRDERCIEDLGESDSCATKRRDDRTSADAADRPAARRPVSR